MTRIFLVGDSPELAAAVLRQGGLRLSGQVPNLTFLLPLVRDCPADVLLITREGLDDWPPEQALPRLRALNPQLRLAVVLQPGEGAAGADRYVAGRSFASTIRLKLRKADLKLQVSEFVAVDWGLSLLAAMAGQLMAGLWLAVVLWTLGLWFPWYYLSFLAEKRVKQVAAQLPDALNIMSNAMKSGYSLLQAMEVVSREMPLPIAGEFGQVLKEIRVNISVEDALYNLTQRVPSGDLDLMVTAMLIQRQIGGNLSEILEKINETIRERIRILGEIKTLTAQGRMSGLIVGSLPFALGMILQVLSPGYITPLFTNPIGWAMLGAAVMMQLVGIVFIRSIIHLEV